MALDAYMTVRANGVEIEGSAVHHEHDRSILVLAYEHKIISPQSVDGRPSGRQQHEVIRVIKEVDQASPLLMKAFLRNENIEMELRFKRLNENGVAEPFYIVQITEGRIAEIRQEMLNNKYAENIPHPVYEYISFAYQHIHWIHEPSGNEYAENIFSRA